MSKASNAFFEALFAILCVILSAVNSQSQSLEARIKVDPGKASVAVSGSYVGSGATGQQRNLSFLDSGIGASNLATRISGLVLADQAGKSIPYRGFNLGEFVAETDFVRWEYETNASAQKNPRSAAHVSWISNDCGILMLDDLLPQMTKPATNATARVALEVPPGWKIVSVEKRVDERTFEVTNIEKAVFVIGKNLREQSRNVGNSILNVAVSGDWHFTDTELGTIVEEILKEYSSIFAANPAENLQVAIIPFPQNGIQKGIWEAETRGRTVTIVSADMPFKTQSLQRLHEQLRHEIFHLWLPNGVNLSGRYDWFYEGFALYQSLKIGVALNQIRFEDFLDTISRAHNIDAIQTPPLSLIDASENRWNGGETQVYARGMLVAFLCDLALLQSSKGRTAVGDIFRRLYASHRPPSKIADANASILKAMDYHPQLLILAAKYIKGSQKIDWQAELASAGIENEPGNSHTNLRVRAKPNSGQKALLDKLGYNNWRKLTRKS